MRVRGSVAGRLTVEAWFQLVLGLMVVLVLASAAAGAQVIGQTMQSSNRLIDRLQPAAAEAYRLQGALLNQETGVRGYAITADPQFLQPYETGRRDEERAVARIRELVGDRPELLRDLEEIERTAAAWRAMHAEPVTDTTTPEQAVAVAAATVAPSKVVFDGLRDRFRTQNADFGVALAADRADLTRTRDIRNTVLLGLVVLFVLAALALTAIVRRLVAHPLRGLTAASLLVAGGEFDHHIEARGPSDLRTVAEAVEDMRRRIVAELQSSRAQEAKLAEQAADLDAQTVELRRSNQELEQFAYVASHDLQEPLRKVASFCQLLEKRYGDQLDERGKQYIDFAVDGAKRMQVLINDLLTFSRVGRVDDTTAPIALDGPLDRALGNLAEVVERAGATIERPAALPEVLGNPTLLIMLWQNLIGNAVKFARPGVPPVVRIECAEAAAGGYEFVVSDNGIGVAPEFAEKVFVIFQRLHNREEYSGTGIGLALCRKIVEFHGGRIAVDTGYTDGARFRFTLPAPR
ncbi:sensor histidine kinase [Nocardia asteroides]|uniref:sensor histidine kinase n=1 Tax=Nocardia asteroides TaxID=1824 RepID=UPI001E5D8E8F|nr:CHASE3 domain-containing protein [Nocardia asteroides]UGT62831.1 CHASE3 domain-containing protein [Nocardia asteroides]